MDTLYALRTATLAAVLAIVLGACATSAGDRPAVRIDATSAETADASFNAMLGQASARERERLLVALIEINFAGIQSAFDVAANPDLQKPSVARIKDRIAGMTAEEIIDYAEQVSTVETEVHRR